MPGEAGTSSVANPFYMRDVLKVSDFRAEDIRALLEEARWMKSLRRKGYLHSYLQGRTLALIFEKPSTRTRVSFEVAMLELGGHPLVLRSDELQLGRGETVEDTARVLSRYVDGILLRTHAHKTLERLAAAADVPVINGLSDLHHPTQVFADLLTLVEHFGPLGELRIAYVGDARNNVTHSWIEAAALLGLTLVVASPAEYRPDPEIWAWAEARAEESGADLRWTSDPREAVADADVIITDTWVSMGTEAEREARLARLRPYQVNEELFAFARKEAVFLHCLPAHRGEEVTDAVLDGPRSLVWDEAENRLHVHKALLRLVFTP